MTLRVFCLQISCANKRGQIRSDSYEKVRGNYIRFHVKFNYHDFLAETLKFKTQMAVTNNHGFSSLSKAPKCH